MGVTLGTSQGGTRQSSWTTVEPSWRSWGGVEMKSVLVPVVCALVLIALSVPVTASSGVELAARSDGRAAIAAAEGAEGDQTMIVPDIVGMPEADATATLEAADLLPGQRTVVGEGEPGVVVAQAPVAGTELPVGSTVDYTVVGSAAIASSPGASDVPSGEPSAAPATAAAEADQTTTMPDIVGMTEADALMAVEFSDLVPGERTVVTEGSAGTVVAQEPGPGTELPVRSAVHYAVVDAGPGEGDGWGAFRDRLRAFLDEMDVMAFFRAMQEPDDELARSLAASMHTTSTDVVAWLDEHPPAPCYDHAWQALRAAAEKMTGATDLFVTQGFDAASSQLMDAGSAFVDLGGMIQSIGGGLSRGRLTRSRDGCRRSPPSQRGRSAADTATASVAAATHALGTSETTARQHPSGLHRRSRHVDATQAAENAPRTTARGLRSGSVPSCWGRHLRRGTTCHRAAPRRTRTRRERPPPSAGRQHPSAGSGDVGSSSCRCVPRGR